nr:CU044_2847 family protein [Streptomyces sp. Ag109_O5-1]
MSTVIDGEFDDGTAVRFMLTGPPAVAVASDESDDLPEGMVKAVPVAAGGGAGAAVAGFTEGALRRVLKPLGPLLRGVHDAVRAVPEPPGELSVTFGVQVGQDLKLGIVGGTGQAHLTVTASWKPTTGAE